MVDRVLRPLCWRFCACENIFAAASHQARSQARTRARSQARTLFEALIFRWETRRATYHGMSIFLAIRSVEDRGDGIAIVHADVAREDADAATVEEVVGNFAAGASIREMGRVAAGTVESLRSGADGTLRLIARVVDPSTLMKLKYKVLRGFELTTRSITLVDRPGAGDGVLMWKAASNMTTELSPFARSFLTEFNTSLAKVLGGGSEHERQLNETDPSQYTRSPGVTPEPRDMSMIHDALRGLRMAEHDHTYDAFRAAFGVGASDDIVHGMLKPSVAPPPDFFAERIVAAGGVALPAYEMLRPVRVPSERAESNGMQKRHKLAKEYSGGAVYNMLLPSD